MHISQEENRQSSLIYDPEKFMTTKRTENTKRNHRFLRSYSSFPCSSRENSLVDEITTSTSHFPGNHPTTTTPGPASLRKAQVSQKKADKTLQR